MLCWFSLNWSIENFYFTCSLLSFLPFILIFELCVCGGGHTAPDLWELEPMPKIEPDLFCYGSNSTIVEQAAKNISHLKKDIFLAACVHYYTQPAAVKHLGNSNPYYKKK